MQIATIKERVCARFGVRLIDMESARREKEVAQARQVAMWLARELTRHSMPAIGAAFQRDHTTVLHACRRVISRCMDDADFERAVLDLRAELASEADKAPEGTL